MKSRDFFTNKYPKIVSSLITKLGDDVDGLFEIIDDYGDKRVDLFSSNHNQDTEADGIVFCGKCGKQK